MAAGAVTVARLATLMEMDLAAYRQGLKTAKTEGDAGAKSIGQSFKEAFRKSASAENLLNFRGLIDQARNQRTPLREVFAGVALDAGRDLRTAITSGIQIAGQRGASFLKQTFGGIASAAKSVLQGVFIGIGFAAFQAATRAISDLIHLIPDLITRGREYGIVVDQIGDATGASAEASSRLAGTLVYLGAPIGSIVNLLGQMSRNLDENEDRLNAAGVATRENSGALLNQVQILENARQAFSRYGDGTAKAALIAREFGRGGLQVLVDYLKLTDEQARQVTADLEAQGLIISESQRNMAETAQREGNRFQNALTGLGQTLFTVIGPQITAFFSNLSDTITAHATEIATAISSVVSFILGMVSSLTGVSTGLDSFSGGIARGNRVVSPYSAQLLQLNVELADLNDKQKAATNSTDAQRKAIDRQIDAVQREITVLQRQEKAQDTLFRRAISGLSRVYQLRLDALDLAERERENLERQRDLNERLNEAQLALAEAQRGEPQGGQRVVDAEAVADAMQQVTDIQQQQAENARKIETDQQRASLEATQAYIESIGELLEKAENKRAALNTLRRRRSVLEERLAAQEAAGDTEGATDTRARIEAIATAEVRAQEQIRNQAKEDSLQRQKALLEEEKAAVKAAVVDTTAIRRRELEKQIKDLEAQNVEWSKLTGKQKDDLYDVTFAITGEGGLTAAMREARDAGVEMGEKIKAAFEGLKDLIDGIITGLGEIGASLDHLNGFAALIADLIALTKLGAGAGGVVAAPFTFAGDTPPRVGTQSQAVIDRLRDQNPKGTVDLSMLGVYASLLKPGMTNEEAVGALIKAGYGKGEGGWIGLRGPELFLGGERGREYVLDNKLSEKFNRMADVFSTMRMPEMVPAGDTVVYTTVNLDGQPLIRLVERHQADRRRF
jgi:hypothetical protein